MIDVYIPDLTERFPEGFDGVDMTDRYFPKECCNDDSFESQMWDDLENENKMQTDLKGKLI